MSDSEARVSAAGAALGRRGAAARLAKMSPAELVAWGQGMRKQRFATMTAEERSDLGRRAARVRWAGHKPKRKGARRGT